MKALCHALLLVLLLIATQQGAVVHEVGHVAGTHGLDARADGGRGAESDCALCPAFAQVVTPAFSHAFHVPLLVRVGAERVVELRQAVPTAELISPRSRGPPSAV